MTSAIPAPAPPGLPAATEPPAFPAFPAFPAVPARPPPGSSLAPGAGGPTATSGPATLVTGDGGQTVLAPGGGGTVVAEGDGNDVIVGTPDPAAPPDLVVFVGDSRRYAITALGEDAFAVRDMWGEFGEDILVDIELVAFRDGTFDLARLAIGAPDARVGEGIDGIVLVRSGTRVSFDTVQISALAAEAALAVAGLMQPAVRQPLRLPEMQAADTGRERPQPPRTGPREIE